MPNIAMDIGATKTIVALTDKGKIVKVKKFPTPKDRGDTLKKVYETIASLKVKPERICAAVAGAIEHDRIRQFTNLDGWDKFDLKSELKKKYRAEAFVMNDGDTSVIAEAESTGHKNSVALTVGTGLGCGAIMGGKLVPGPHASHMVLVMDGVECKCGSRGCLEAYTCTEAVRRLTKEHYGKPLENPELMRLFRKGDEKARHIYHEMGTALGVGMTSVINLFHPDAIVFAGGLINKEIFTAMESSIRPACYSRPKLIMSKIKDDSSLMGAMLVAEGKFKV